MHEEFMMDNQTKSSPALIIPSPTFIWCFLMPSIHIFSLLSNILCIIVFASKTFVKKPIAIYFISLLISDSMTLLIGYIEMIDRESNMIDKSSWLCTVNEKIIHRLVDSVYSFMERYCLEWMLYKVLWTRASTILLAILSIQRSRTFFSLAYHERRSCAFSACIVSVLIAMIVTCLEWIYVQCGRVGSEPMYLEILHEILNRNGTKEFYSQALSGSNGNSDENYLCLTYVFNETSLEEVNKQYNCSSDLIASQFYNFTQSLIVNRNLDISDAIITILRDLRLRNNNTVVDSSLIHSFNQAPDAFIKLFERRPSQIWLNYQLWIRAFHFIYSVSFGFNRHTIAIFIGNALPSFIVLLANLLSIKVIYFSKSLKYLKQASSRSRRKSRLQSDLRAFLVIIIESCSIIMISWGIPIYMTMFHCGTLYVESISLCPKIKGYLAIFLYADLFNSSTNCFLYSLSGKLFRRKFLSVLKSILTRGRGTLWHVKQNSLVLARQPLVRQCSHNASTNTNYQQNNGVRTSRSGSRCLSQRISSPTMKNFNANPIDRYDNSNSTKANRTKFAADRRHHQMSDETSLNIRRTSDEQGSGRFSSFDIESDSRQASSTSKIINNQLNSNALKRYFFGKVRVLGSNRAVNEKYRPVQRVSINLRANANSQHKSETQGIFPKRKTMDDSTLSTRK